MRPDRVVILLDDFSFSNGIQFKKGQEFELVTGVVYVNGAMMDPRFQKIILDWINQNPKLFKNDTRNW